MQGGTKYKYELGKADMSEVSSPKVLFNHERNSRNTNVSIRQPN